MQIIPLNYSTICRIHGFSFDSLVASSFSTIALTVETRDVKVTETTWSLYSVRKKDTAMFSCLLVTPIGWTLLWKWSVAIVLTAALDLRGLQKPLCMPCCWSSDALHTQYAQQREPVELVIIFIWIIQGTQGKNLGAKTETDTEECCAA